MGFSRQEYWSGLPLPSPFESPGKPTNIGVGSLFLLQGDLPDPGIKPGSPALQAGSLPAELLQKLLFPLTYS